jgi:hypothetical protein
VNPANDDMAREAAEAVALRDEFPFLFRIDQLFDSGPTVANWLCLQLVFKTRVLKRFGQSSSQHFRGLRSSEYIK